MSRVRGSVVVGAAVIAVLGLAGCGGGTQAAADGKPSAQEKGKAACEILVALDFKNPSTVEYIRHDLDTVETKDYGWQFAGALHVTTNSGVATYTYGCSTDKDGKVISKVELPYTG